MQLRVPPSHPQGQRGFDSVIDISNKKEKIANKNFISQVLNYQGDSYQEDKLAQIVSQEITCQGG